MNNDKIKNIINTYINGTDIYLFDIVIRGNANNPVIEIFVDTEDGITIKQCEKLNREIGEILEEDDEGLVRYRLDVSSPGIDRPLKYSWQYTKNIGRNIELQYTDDNKNSQTLEGVLQEVGEADITIVSEGEEFCINKNMIKTAIVKPKWS